MNTHFLLMLVLVEVSAWPQGAVRFVNKFTLGSIDAPITYSGCGPASGRPDGTNAIHYGSQFFGGIYARAALYGGPAGTPENALVQLGAPIGFRTGAAAGYLVTTNSTRIVTDVPVGSAAVFQVRAWDLGYEVTSWDAAWQSQSTGYTGVSELINIQSLGDTNAPSLLFGLQSFSLHVGMALSPPVISIRNTGTNTIVLSLQCCGEADAYDFFLEVQTNLFGPAITYPCSDLSGPAAECVCPFNPNTGTVFYRVKVDLKGTMSTNE